MALSFAIFLCLGIVVLYKIPQGINSAPHSCCRSVTNKTIPINNLVSFTIQKSDGQCRIAAIVFVTNRRKKICGDPSDKVVEKAMKRLQKKKNTKLCGNPKKKQAKKKEMKVAQTKKGA
ncbi:C-C motif chemokine 8-like isoform X2 [Protopterus annectens]|uniref:C-C motif chemokine 8-like isoform X2 n=1 Tax=Protopterus annectens TaxID=7888 RepID=UPI001CF9BC1E|nr:C-C motif chemokine 8-like isoform X2 [Protopterus annectens]